jgi:hypothetical protein
VPSTLDLCASIHMLCFCFDTMERSLEVVRKYFSKFWNVIFFVEKFG